MAIVLEVFWGPRLGQDCRRERSSIFFGSGSVEDDDVGVVVEILGDGQGQFGASAIVVVCSTSFGPLAVLWVMRCDDWVVWVYGGGGFPVIGLRFWVLWWWWIVGLWW